MAELASIDKLVEEIQGKIRGEMAEGLRPLLKQLADTLSELEKVVGGAAPRAAASSRGSEAPAAAGKTGARRGRPPKSASGAGAPAAKGRPGRPRKEAGSAPAASGRRAKSAGGKLPRGALQGALKQVLGKGGSLKLQEITKAVMALPEYKNRPEKSVYTQIIQGIKRIPEIQRNADGEYALKGGKG